MMVTTQNKRLLSWSSGVLASCALAVFAGCSRGANDSTQAYAVRAHATSTPTARPTAARGSARSSFVETNDITRRAQVPDGVETASGLTVPRGFQVNVFAEGLTNPRRIAIAPNGTPGRYDVFVAESRANRISVLRESNGDGHADAKYIFADGLSQPYGIAFNKSWIYVGNTDAVVRFPYQAREDDEPAQTSTDQPPQKITELTRGGYNQHWTRNLLFSPDGKKLFVTVGSSCNTCEESDPQRAAISVMNPDGSGKRVFASGLRNPVGLAWRNNHELWTVVNERDRLGDDVPPDYLTLVKEGSFYGWPYAYTSLEGEVKPDPKFGDKVPDKVKSTRPASVPVQAHSAALGLAFYPEAIPRVAGRYSGFPKEYSGDAFLAYHGSWNRSEKTGYKIVRVNFKNNKAVSITDFVTGFLKDGRVSGRPVDVQIAPDGSLLFSDDSGGKIWRVSRTP
jgi:glucose/arabinose dehydrogenase